MCKCIKPNLVSYTTNPSWGRFPVALIEASVKEGGARLTAGSPSNSLPTCRAATPWSVWWSLAAQGFSAPI